LLLKSREENTKKVYLEIVTVRNYGEKSEKSEKIRENQKNQRKSEKSKKLLWIK
jgi:hypothetical protein